MTVVIGGVNVACDARALRWTAGLEVDADGSPRGTIVLPPLPSADESFRPLSVDDDGAVYEMSPGPLGLDVTRYVFP